MVNNNSREGTAVESFADGMDAGTPRLPASPQSEMTVRAFELKGYYSVAHSSQSCACVTSPRSEVGFVDPLQ